MSAEKRPFDADHAEDMSDQGEETDLVSSSPNDPSDVSSARSGLSGRWRFRHWRALLKISAILVIPLMAVLALAGAQIRDSLADEAHARRAEQLAGLNIQGVRFSRELQVERDLTGVYLGSHRQQGTDKLQEQRSRVDDIAREYNSAQQQIDAEFNPSTRQLLGDISQSISDLAEIRQDVDNDDQLQWSAAFTKYSRVVALFEKLPNQAAQEGLANPTFRAQSIGVTALSVNSNLLSAERGYWAYVYSSGKFQGTDQKELFGIDARQRAAADDFLTNSTSDQRGAFQSAITETLTDPVDQLRKTALDASSNAQLHVNSTEWFNKSSDLLAEINSVHEQLAQELKDKAESLRSGAQRTTIVILAIVCLVVVGSSALAVLGARILLNPIRQLRAAALDVIHNRLPNLSRPGGSRAETERNAIPIPMRTADEIGEVAGAFNSLYQAVVKSAADQELLRQNVSATFVNLSRRTQSLVERQLRVIDDLERGEQDPEQLGHLFQIDHLATRMRRNAENLLVLAGAESGRRWSQPIALLDVLRAAAAEVEQYHRVVNSDIADCHVEGRVVGDLVHLIAELLENALEFSSPNTNVVVRAQRTADASGVEIEIKDHGIGMSEHELIAANHRLATTNEDELELSRMMGLYVVGRLAARLHIHVELRAIPDGGVLVSIKIPDHVIVGQHSDRVMPSEQSPALSELSPETTNLANGDNGQGIHDGLPHDEKLVSETRPLLPVKGLSRREPASNDNAARPLLTTSSSESLAAEPDQTDIGQESIDAGVTVDAAMAQENAFAAIAAQESVDALAATSASESVNAEVADSVALSTDSLVATAEATHQDSVINPSGEDSLDTILQSTGFSEVPQQSHQPETENAVARVIDPDEEAFIESTQEAPIVRSGLDDAATPASLEQAIVGDTNTGENPEPASAFSSNGNGNGNETSDGNGHGNGNGNGNGIRNHDLDFADFNAVPVPTIDDNEYLPIFAQMESEWFKHRRSSDHRDSILPSTKDSLKIGDVTGQPDPGNLIASSSAKAMDQSTTSTSSTGATSSWTSPADEGWRAAQQAMKPRISGTTKAGLPIRVPLAHYVPGSVGGESSRVPSDRRTLPESENPRGAISSRDSIAGSEQPPLPIKRSPEAVRGLLSNYHRGLRQGREAGRHHISPETNPETKE